MPDWLKRITGSDTLLNVASSLSGSTSAEGLEEMTLAMITGKDAAFLDMVDQLICWVKDREKPDIIHLSSTLASRLLPSEMLMVADLPLPGAELICPW